MIVLVVIVAILVFIAFSFMIHLLVVANKRTEGAIQRAKETKIDYEELDKFF